MMVVIESGEAAAAFKRGFDARFRWRRCSSTTVAATIVVEVLPPRLIGVVLLLRLALAACIAAPAGGEPLRPYNAAMTLLANCRVIEVLADHGKCAHAHH